MGKYAKFALVLLYVVQLAVLFKDQLIHLYKDAVEAVHRQPSYAHHEPADGGHREESRAARLPDQVFSRAAPIRFDPRAALFSLPHLQALLAMHGEHQGDGHRHEPHPPHDDDKHKDRPKKRIVWPPRVILYANLFGPQRISNAHPQSVEPREEAEMLSLLLHEAAA